MSKYVINLIFEDEKREIYGSGDIIEYGRGYTQTIQGEVFTNNTDKTLTLLGAELLNIETKVIYGYRMLPRSLVIRPKDSLNFTWDFTLIDNRKNNE